MIALPWCGSVERSPVERAARARALRLAFGPVSGWPEDVRAEFAERAAILAVDGLPDADRAAEGMVRAELVRRAP